MEVGSLSSLGGGSSDGPDFAALGAGEQVSAGGYSTQSQFEELKQMVTGTLERRGVLAKMQAQLRSHIFKALMEQETVDHSTEAPHLRTDAPSEMALELIREFLRFHAMDYTLSILTVESGETQKPAVTRTSMASILGITRAQKAEGSREPLLVEFIRETMDRRLEAQQRVAGQSPDTSPKRLKPHATVEFKDFSNASANANTSKRQTVDDSHASAILASITAPEKSGALPALAEIADELEDISAIKPLQMAQMFDESEAMRQLVDKQKGSEKHIASDYASILEAATNELEKVRLTHSKSSSATPEPLSQRRLEEMADVIVDVSDSTVHIPSAFFPQ